jgi:hypothetical protein
MKVWKGGTATSRLEEGYIDMEGWYRYQQARGRIYRYGESFA